MSLQLNSEEERELASHPVPATHGNMELRRALGAKVNNVTYEDCVNSKIPIADCYKEFPNYKFYTDKSGKELYRIYGFAVRSDGTVVAQCVRALMNDNREIPNGVPVTELQAHDQWSQHALAYILTHAKDPGTFLDPLGFMTFIPNN